MRSPSCSCRNLHQVWTSGTFSALRLSSAASVLPEQGMGQLLPQLTWLTSMVHPSVKEEGRAERSRATVGRFGRFEKMETALVGNCRVCNSRIYIFCMRKARGLKPQYLKQRGWERNLGPTPWTPTAGESRLLCWVNGPMDWFFARQVLWLPSMAGSRRWWWFKNNIWINK